MTVTVHRGGLASARSITPTAIVIHLLIGPLGLQVRDEAHGSVKLDSCLSLDTHVLMWGFPE
jgi:hypothetical protein